MLLMLENVELFLINLNMLRFILISLVFLVKNYKFKSVYFVLEKDDLIRTNYRGL